jgi:hypothetical protein
LRIGFKLPAHMSKNPIRCRQFRKQADYRRINAGNSFVPGAENLTEAPSKLAQILLAKAPFL